MSMSVIDDETGMVMLGRHNCTLEVVQATFVDASEFETSASRRKIWDAWKAVTTELRSKVPVAAVWISGSFTTKKLNPSDMDCTYIIDHQEMMRVRADPDSVKLIDLIAKNELGGTCNLPLDTFLISWKSFAQPASSDISNSNYFATRGYWDDFWQRVRQGNKSDTPTESWSIPRRGYLEVTLDGYIR